MNHSRSTVWPKNYLCLLWTTALLSLAAWTAEVEAEDLPLTLEQAVQLALARHLELRTAVLDTQLQALGVAAEQARFGRRLSSVLSHQSERAPSISRLEGVPTATTNRQAFTWEVSQDLASGGQVGVGVSSSRAASNLAYLTAGTTYQWGVEVRFSQPLGQGRGAVNRLPEEVARLGLAAAAAGWREKERAVRAAVGQAYWEQFYAQAALAVQQQLQAGAARVLAQVQAQAGLGLQPPSAVLQAEVGVAQREEAVVVAEGAWRTAEDRLKGICGLDQEPGGWAVRVVLVDTPAVGGELESWVVGVERALAVSGAYRQAQVQEAQARVQEALAEDRLRPAVGLSGQGGLSGIGTSYGAAGEGLGQGDGRRWQGGLSVSWPLGTSSERVQVQQRQVAVQRQQAVVAAVRQQLVQQVRQQHRQVQVAQRRVALAERRVVLARQQVAEQEARLALGLATVKEVLDAQDELAQAQLSQWRARVDYCQALLAWNQLTGE